MKAFTVLILTLISIAMAGMAHADPDPGAFSTALILLPLAAPTYYVGHAIDPNFSDDAKFVQVNQTDLDDAAVFLDGGVESAALAEVIQNLRAKGDTGSEKELAAQICGAEEQY